MGLISEISKADNLDYPKVNYGNNFIYVDTGRGVLKLRLILHWKVFRINFLIYSFCSFSALASTSITSSSS